MVDYARDFPTLSDPLGETLYHLRLEGSLYGLSDLTAPWGIELPPLQGKMMFHIVTQGQCWLMPENGEPVLLREGSLVLVPHGRGHNIADQPSTPLIPFFDLPVQKISDRYELLSHGGGGELTKLTCCVMSFDHIAGKQLLAQLPSVLHIDAWHDDIDNWLQYTLRFIAREAKAQRPGGETILSNLADILVIQAIRSWIDSAAEANSGWLAALKDKHIGTALAAIHREPAKNWTVESLAKEVGMSRSGFSARFSQLVGDSVIRYLTHWRMLLARAKLSESAISLGQLAEELGYQSEAAFCRAYKRTMGESPGSVRLVPV